MVSNIDKTFKLAIERFLLPRNDRVLRMIVFVLIQVSVGVTCRANSITLGYVGGVVQ